MKRLSQLFSIIILAFFTWAIGFSIDSTQRITLESQTEFQKKYTSADFSHVQKVEVEEGEFVVIESEPELEIQIDWFPLSIKSFEITKSSLKRSSNSYTSLLFSSKETIPLYDLYCNWKFHLS
ncbi:MAG: hypothetical protein EKK56_09575 [Flavobacteriaceae bacterium]|nr:MAG: hypothetical protein EKK56_09575 [Flavobacteriaceae bacterium]